MDIDKIEKGHELVGKLLSIDNNLSDLKDSGDLSFITLTLHGLSKYYIVKVDVKGDRDLMNTIKQSCLDKLEKMSKELTKEIEEL